MGRWVSDFVARNEIYDGRCYKGRREAARMDVSLRKFNGYQMLGVQSVEAIAVCAHKYGRVLIN